MRGNVRPLASEMSIAQGLVFSFQRRIKAAMSTMVAVMQRAAFFAGVALVGALGKATQAAGKFESQVSDIARLIGRDAAEPIANSIREMANVMPVAQGELLGVAEEAARLGIRGTANIRQFTRVMAEIGVATSATAEEAIEAMGKMLVALQLPVSEVRNLGSAINELAKIGPGTFSDILSATQRAAPELSRLGATAPEIGALATTLAQVSASSARAGTRLRRLGQEIQDVANVEDLAAALQVTTREFRQMRRFSPTETIIELAKVMRRGGEQAEILQDALGSAARTALAGLGQALPDLEANLEAATRGFEEGTSLSEAFQEQIEDMFSQLRALGNRLLTVGQALGDAIIPGFENFVKVLGNNTDVIQSAFMPAAESIGDFFQFLADNFPTIVGILAAVRRGFINLGMVIGNLVGFTKKSAQVLIGTLGEIGLNIGIAINKALAAAFRKLQDIPGVVGDAFRRAADTATERVTELQRQANDLAESTRRNMAEAGENFATLGAIITGEVPTIVDAFNRARNAATDLQTSLIDSGESAQDATEDFQGLAIRGIRTLGRVANSASVEFEPLRMTLEQTGKAVLSTFDRFKEFIRVMKAAGSDVQRLARRMNELQVAFKTGLIDREELVKRGEELIEEFQEVVEDGMKRMERRLKQAAVTIGTELVRGIIRGIDSAKEFLVRVMESLALALVQTGLRSVLGIASPSQMTAEVGREIVGGLIQGMRDMEPALARASSDIANTASVDAGARMSRIGQVAGAAAGSGGGGGGQPIHVSVNNEVSALSLRDARRQIPKLNEEMTRSLVKSLRNSEALRRMLSSGGKA